MMVDLMFMIIHSLGSFLTAVTPTPVATIAVTLVHFGSLGFTWLLLVNMQDVKDLLSENEDHFLGGGGLEVSVRILPRYTDPIGSNNSISYKIGYAAKLYDTLNHEGF